MSNYNPKVYNYSNLKDEDKKLIRMMLSMVDSTMEVMEEFELQKEYEDETILNKIAFEERGIGADEARRSMLYDIVEEIVYLIDNYDEEVSEKETDDFFYGITKESPSPYTLN